MSTIKIIRIYLLLILFSCPIIYPQYVSTITSGNGLNGPDGFALDSNNNLFISNWGLISGGTTVLKMDPSGNITTFLTGLDAPDGLVFDSAGNLFISNFNTGIINKATPAGEISVYAQGLNHPSALVFDKAWNLYVSNHGNANGTTVSKISKDGSVSIFASGFNGPVGLAFDSVENLYVSNYTSGIINKVTIQGEVSIFAAIPNVPRSYIQYLAFDKAGNLYVPSYGLQKIFRITAGGEVSVFAGTGQRGGVDGRVDSAQFDGPNSIAITSAGDMYISDFSKNRIRKITSSVPTMTDRELGYIPERALLYQNYPNPFNPLTKIRFSIPAEEGVILKVFNILGKEVSTILNERKNAGNHLIEFNSGNLPSGIYFYRLQTGSYSMIEKMCILK